MDDYVPSVNEERFPRNDIKKLGSDEDGNKYNAWAWQCTVKDSKANDGLLSGKTVCLKVSNPTREGGR